MPVKIEVVIDDAGQIQVNGPIQDKILCLGVLRLAEQLIINFKPPAVVPASQVPPVNGSGPHLRRV